MDKDFRTAYNKCPACGCTKRFFEELLEELKVQGLIPPATTRFDFQQKQGVTLPPQKIATLPIGTEIPAFDIVWDICTECGCMYATVAQRLQAVKSLEQPRIILPTGVGEQLPKGQRPVNLGNIRNN